LAYRFPSNDDASFSEEVFNIPMAEIEAIGEPDCITDDVGRESMAFVGVHRPILAILAS